MSNGLITISSTQQFLYKKSQNKKIPPSIHFSYIKSIHTSIHPSTWLSLKLAGCSSWLVAESIFSVPDLHLHPGIFQSNELGFAVLQGFYGFRGLLFQALTAFVVEICSIPFGMISQQRRRRRRRRSYP